MKLLFYDFFGVDTWGMDGWEDRLPLNTLRNILFYFYRNLGDRNENDFRFDWTTSGECLSLAVVLGN